MNPQQSTPPAPENAPPSQSPQQPLQGQGISAMSSIPASQQYQSFESYSSMKGHHTKGFLIGFLVTIVAIILTAAFAFFAFSYYSKKADEIKSQSTSEQETY